MLKQSLINRLSRLGNKHNVVTVESFKLQQEAKAFWDSRTQEQSDAWCREQAQYYLSQIPPGQEAENNVPVQWPGMSDDMFHVAVLGWAVGRIRKQQMRI